MDLTGQTALSMDTHIDHKQRFQQYIQRDFDKVFTCHKDYTDKFSQVPSEWLPVAFDPDFHKPLNLPRIYDLAFVGNADAKVYPERAEWLGRLSKKFKVGIFSNIFGEETVKVWNQTKIAFNRSFSGDLNHRVFEVMGCGTFLLTDSVQNGFPDLFTDGNQLATYSNYDELESKVAYYLEHDDEREEIARRGHQDALDKHTYYHRAKTLVDCARAI